MGEGKTAALLLYLQKKTMNKTIITYGILSGGIMVISLTSLSYLGIQSNNMTIQEIIGFATMILAMSFVFIGVRAVKRQNPGESFTFWSALKTGLLIALISSVMYVVAWMIISYLFFPEFMEKYAECRIENLKSEGATTEKINDLTKEMNQMKEDYKNPFYRIGITFMEIFPVGLLAALISAAVLRTRKSA